MTDTTTTTPDLLDRGAPPRGAHRRARGRGRRARAALRPGRRRSARRTDLRHVGPEGARRLRARSGQLAEGHRPAHLRRPLDRLGHDGGRRWPSAPAPPTWATRRSRRSSAASASRSSPGRAPGPARRCAQDGGHLLSGSWQFASGIKHSGFIHTLGVVEGTGEPRIFVLPVEQATLIDNWDVMGLRATGSIDYDDRLGLRPRALLALRRHRDARARRQPLPPRDHQHRRHLPLGLGAGHRAAPDRRAGQDGPGEGRPARRSIAENPSFHEELRRTPRGSDRAARALIFETWSDVTETLARGEELSVDQNTSIRLGTIHVTWAAHEVAKFVYAVVGDHRAARRARSSSSSATCTRARST